ncbi:zinc finger protein [Perkinsela sp. CCAP 1560/4]|nr:zinc finger protein [Perkinsela sp. CCAP 1560/4]|eukprot:KNH04269.1 zinc finger protein [Perkinsela sp. CCAP 1560/4]
MNTNVSDRAKNAQEIPRPFSTVVSFDRKNVNHVILLDLDNVCDFFLKADVAEKVLCAPPVGLPFLVPNGVFIWCFNNVKLNMMQNTAGSRFFYSLLENQMVEFDIPAGTGKNSADTVLALCVGRLGTLCPDHIPFTLISEDRSFDELVRRKRQQRDIIRFTRYINYDKEDHSTHLDFFHQLHMRLTQRTVEEAARHTVFPYNVVKYDRPESVAAQVRRARAKSEAENV